MAQLALFNNTENGIELVINGDTGESFATVRGYARMSGRDASTISRRLKGVAAQDQKTAKVLTAGGLQGFALISESVMTDWIVDDSPTLAKAMLKAGVRVYLHKLAGFEITSTAITPTESAQPALPQTYLEALKALVESEEEKERLRVQNELLEGETDDLEADNDRLSELTDKLLNYSSIGRIAKLNGISETAFKWRKLKAASQMVKIEVKRVPCPRFGEKLFYSHQAWAIAYPDVELPESPHSGIVLHD